jgi:hypothetical protein
MKSLASTLLVTIALAVFGGEAAAHGRADQKGPKHQRGRSDDRRASEVTAVVRFSTGDVRIIRQYYAPRYRPLPPGLQKKLARGGSLPPGWQKKLQPFPVVLERELVALPGGYRRGVFEGYAVVYDARTQVIVDITALF